MMDTIFVDCFSDGIDYTIMIDGKQHRFEYGGLFGPVRMTQNGTTHKKEWTARQWDCVQAWCDQGGRHENGVCIYDDPKGEEAE